MSRKKSGRGDMLAWLKSRTKGYENVEVEDFTDSWVDGLAFCAVLHSYCPDLIDYNGLQPEAKLQNLDLAFTIAEKLGIPKLMLPGDLLGEDGPNKFSVITYLAQFVDHFRDTELRTPTPTPSPPAPISVGKQFEEHEESKRHEEERKKRVKGGLKKYQPTPSMGKRGTVAEMIAEFEIKAGQKRTYRSGDPFLYETVPTGLVGEKIVNFMKQQGQNKMNVEFIMVTSTTPKEVTVPTARGLTRTLSSMSNIYYIMKDKERERDGDGDGDGDASKDNYRKHRSVP